MDTRGVGATCRAEARAATRRQWRRQGAVTADGVLLDQHARGTLRLFYLHDAVGVRTGARPVLSCVAQDCATLAFARLDVVHEARDKLHVLAAARRRGWQWVRAAPPHRDRVDG